MVAKSCIFVAAIAYESDVLAFKTDYFRGIRSEDGSQVLQTRLWCLLISLHYFGGELKSSARRARSQYVGDRFLHAAKIMQACNQKKH
jgi:hypothetical protein